MKSFFAYLTLALMGFYSQPDPYFEGLKNHALSFQKGTVQIVDTLYVLQQEYHDNYDDKIGSVHIKSVSRDDLYHRTAKKQRAFITIISPISVVNDRLVFTVTNFDVSRRKRKYTFESCDPTKNVLVFETDSFSVEVID